jgi:hypothetical protein
MVLGTLWIKESVGEEMEERRDRLLTIIRYAVIVLHNCGINK